ncbi:hypothetical protein DL89DRAFT_266032 [Linderina pennispora]|uniref:Uncharacterized protein n=1 Tax=Linderina pennispora TaxID=61395 RepID=A0A1Y1WG52_9FUNG|nr:uncharacterized protein DL89DRAFT_266032 [Linderina pennispora]ORX72467.1 hypothetical protein DL89DRAFT_266032 [Linderina pennispora]
MYCGWKGDGGALAGTLSGSTSAGATSVETTPVETTPAETTPVETTPAETTPAETTPAETTPAETTPAETTSAEIHFILILWCLPTASICQCPCPTLSCRRSTWRIAVTGLHLPTITIPSLNPASLTNFAYIEGILSKAHMSFDDIANLPLPDLESISLPNMGSLNIGNLMGMMGGGGLGNVPQTTTLGQDEIINAIGISMITDTLNH